jgi:hypothetical protein
MRRFLPERNTNGSKRFQAAGSSRGVLAKRENNRRVIDTVVLGSDTRG